MDEIGEIQQDRIRKTEEFQFINIPHEWGDITRYSTDIKWQYGILLITLYQLILKHKIKQIF